MPVDRDAEAIAVPIEERVPGQSSRVGIGTSRATPSRRSTR